MIEVIKSEDRGKTKIGWLESYHSFSFGEYYNPKREAFRSLRVINDDYIKAGGGFPFHPHKDMEIITYVISGAVEHRDTIGSSGIIKAGELQVMTAGSGVRHSEFNSSQTEDLHLLQIWITPRAVGLTPSYSDWKEKTDNNKTLLASPDGNAASLIINQDVNLYLIKQTEQEMRHAIAAGRYVWIQMLSGKLNINGNIISAGDGLAVSGEASLDIKLLEKSEYLLFDLN